MDTASPPKIWLDYDQAELDRQYDQRSVVPDGDDYKASDAKASEQARSTTPCRVDVAYGDGADETLDIFPARDPGSPVVVFLHGGAWTRGKKSNESFIAPPLVGAGAAVVVVGFTLCPQGTLRNMVDQCRRAIAWVHANAGDFNADPARIVVTGHSSGSHLTAMMMVTDWASHGIAPEAIKGYVITSGIYDLAPVRLTYRNEYLNLDDDAVDELSPIRHLKPGLPPLALFYGGLELAEFRRQGREFADAVRATGADVTEQDLPGFNHFEMGRKLAEADGPVFKAALGMLER
ncbi:MAG: alpha/beta hydrolase [Rhodospirillales bacterium]